ncbi:MAG: hypothetical protein U0354_11515 [Candidatus Sericytochromatia bacterium]
MFKLVSNKASFSDMKERIIIFLRKNDTLNKIIPDKHKLLEELSNFISYGLFNSLI